MACSRPGKPTGHADIESFNGSLREECLNVHWFEDLTDARAKLQVWSYAKHILYQYRGVSKYPFPL